MLRPTRSSCWLAARWSTRVLSAVLSPPPWGTWWPRPRATGPLPWRDSPRTSTRTGLCCPALLSSRITFYISRFVDPIGQAVPVVQHVAPVINYAAAPAVHYAAAPAISYAALKPVEVKPVEVKAAPVAVQYSVPAATVPVVHTAPVVQHIGYNVHHQVHHVPQVSVQKHTTQHVTQHVINHAPVVGAYAGLPLAGLPVVAAAAPAVVEDAE